MTPVHEDAAEQRGERIPPPGTSEAGGVPVVDPGVVQRRLAELSRELQEGQSRLQALDAERAGLRDTILRIEGAIVVLQELGGSGAAASDGHGRLRRAP